MAHLLPVWSVEPTPQAFSCSWPSFRTAPVPVPPLLGRGLPEPMSHLTRVPDAVAQAFRCPPVTTTKTMREMHR